MSILSRTRVVGFRAKKGLKRKTRLGETVIQGLLVFSGILSIFTTIGIVYELGKEALLFFRNPAVSLVEFFTAAKWQPTIEEFGILPLVVATLVTTFFAMLVAIPLGLAVAIYLSEYATPRARNTIKPTLEILAGIPTIVYGYFALTFMTPLLRSIFGANTVDIYNTGFGRSGDGNSHPAPDRIHDGGCVERGATLLA